MVGQALRATPRLSASASCADSAPVARARWTA